MAAQDLIGKRGEAIVVAALTDFGGRELPYFDPHPLGEKCPTFDYLVELLDAGEYPAYFLVQVKSTRKGQTKREHRLKAGVSEEDVRKMCRCPIPAYVVGVDDVAGAAFILSIHGRMTQAIPSVPTDYPLDEANRRTLWTEVRDHWATLRSATARTSAFKLRRRKHAPD